MCITPFYRRRTRKAPKSPKGPKSPTKKPFNRTTPQDLSVPSACLVLKSMILGTPPFYPRKAMKQAFLHIVHSLAHFFNNVEDFRALSRIFEHVAACWSILVKPLTPTFQPRYTPSHPAYNPRCAPRYSPFAPPLHPPSTAVLIAQTFNLPSLHLPCTTPAPFVTAPSHHPYTPLSPYTSLTPSHPLDTHLTRPIKPLHTPHTTPPLHFPSHVPETPPYPTPPPLTPPLHPWASLHCTAEEPVKPERAQKAKAPPKNLLKERGPRICPYPQ